MDAFHDMTAEPPPEGTAEVPVQQPEALPPTGPASPTEDINLVGTLTEEERKRIVDITIRDFDADVDSREPRMRRLAEFQGLYASVTKAKAFPFRNAANVTLPILV